MMTDYVKSTILEFQEKEITEHFVYKRLSEKSKGRNAIILKRISEDELKHYNEWKKYTQREVQPSHINVSRYLFFYYIFGLTFVMKILEGNEKKAQEAYNKISDNIPNISELITDEVEHENMLIGMIDDKRLNYLSSMIQGLNDALIGLAGQIAGFTFALQNTQLIGFAGLIAGFAQFLSNSASEIEIYFSQKTEENRASLVSSLYMGASYMITVIILIIPYFIFSNYYVALSLNISITLIIIGFFTFFVSVVKDISIREMFLAMFTVSFCVSAISFTIGWITKVLLNL